MRGLILISFILLGGCTSCSTLQTLDEGRQVVYHVETKMLHGYCMKATETQCGLHLTDCKGGFEFRCAQDVEVLDDLAIARIGQMLEEQQRTIDPDAQTDAY